MIRICQIYQFGGIGKESGEHTALASLCSTENGNPGNSGMTMQHFHGDLSRFARIIRLTSASPIPFSIFTSLISVLQAGNKAYSPLKNVHPHEVMKNWFSIYTKCFDPSIAPWDQDGCLRIQPGELTCYVCVLDGMFGPIRRAK